MAQWYNGVIALHAHVAPRRQTDDRMEQCGMETPPPSAAKFFWDTDPSRLDVDGDYFFIIERLMEEGDDSAIHWMIHRYSDAQRIEVLRRSRRLSRKTARLWQNYYSLGEEEIQCLSTSCPRVGWKF